MKTSISGEHGLISTRGWLQRNMETITLSCAISQKTLGILFHKLSELCIAFTRTII